MSIELKVPSAGESITEVTIVEWVKAVGESAEADETLAVIETDKANVELLAPQAGTLTKILKEAGALAEVGEVVGYLEVGAGNGAATKAERPVVKKASAESKAAEPASAEPKAAEPKAAEPKAAEPKAADKKATEAKPESDSGSTNETMASPAVRRAMRERGLDPASVKPSGGRVTMDDLDRRRETPAAPTGGSRATEKVKMTRLRSRIAQRLVTAQQDAALLTTFNEVDMTAVKRLRKQYQERFVDRYGIKLGFMSFFIKAVIEALEAFPAINAYVDGDEIVYHDYYDIGVAVGGGRGLVVPVIRNAERLSFSQIEQAIADFGRRAKANKLTIDELQGGTFTISNGGVYGSLMSTPIVNPPQSGILGMHAIQDRPIVRDGAIVVAPMMYLALTYDHRLVDGREAVTFLVKIKERIEDPTRLLLEV